MADRPDVPAALLRRINTILKAFPQCMQGPAWAGHRWRVGSATVAHVFGGEDQLFRLTFRAEAGELLAFENLGHPYFRTEWGANTVGVVLDDSTDWTEIREYLTDSYCLQAPAHLVEQVKRPRAR